jgi:site-specific recombinase XerD
MTALDFQSCLSKEIQTFIDLRRLSGTDYRSQALLLGYFDRFLIEQKTTAPRITQQITDLYLQSLSSLAPRSRANRFCVVRQLCQYLTGADPLGYVPESLKTIRSESGHQPYIYSESELQKLLRAASELAPQGQLRPHTYRTLLGLLYTTGIRIGEAMALKLGDFSRAEQQLYIAEGKFRKARWVPLSISGCAALDSYIEKRMKTRPASQDSSLFLNQCSRRLHYCTVNHTFHQLLRQSGIARSKRDGPRIHDLRHTFAVHRLMGWYRDGRNLNSRLPWLATYLGHVSVHSTQVYLRATGELIEQVHQRFHNYYLDQVQSHGGYR